MSYKANQLVLEILLLRERYDARDLVAAAGMLRDRARDPFLSEVAELLLSGNKRPESPKGTRKTRVSLIDQTNAFLNAIRNDMSPKSKRLAAIAKRLGVSITSENRDRFSDIVAEKLEAMNEVERSNFLRPYKVTPGADQGYVNLASFLISKPS